MQASHKVPTHMRFPDRVVFGLTARQLLILLIGCSASYDVWLQLHALSPHHTLLLVLRLSIAVLPTAAAAALALISVASRPLEVWLLVLFRYWQQPRTYVWRSLHTLPPEEDLDADSETEMRINGSLHKELEREY